MPLYEFRCRTCDTTFELRRPMSEASDPASCPDGHDGAVRLLSVFATAGASVGASTGDGACRRGRPVAAAAAAAAAALTDRSAASSAARLARALRSRAARIVVVA